MSIGNLVNPSDPQFQEPNGDGGLNIKGTISNDRLQGSVDDDFLRSTRDDDVVWGGAGDDSVIGGRGDDTIDGGLGADLLTGDQGILGLRNGDNDVFQFGNGINPGGDIGSLGIDTVTDFNPDDDQIALEGTVFGLTGPGPILDAQFESVTSALVATTAANIIYDNTLGILYSNLDGVAGGPDLVAFAQLDGAPSLALGDLEVF